MSASQEVSCLLEAPTALLISGHEGPVGFLCMTATPVMSPNSILSILSSENPTCLPICETFNRSSVQLCHASCPQPLMFPLPLTTGSPFTIENAHLCCSGNLVFCDNTFTPLQPRGLPCTVCAQSTFEK